MQDSRCPLIWKSMFDRGSSLPSWTRRYAFAVVPSLAGKRIRVKPLRRGIADRRYDDRKNHEFLREELHVHSIIPTRNENVPVWRTVGSIERR